MNLPTNFRPFQTWTTETIQEELNEMKKYNRPAPVTIKNMQRMEAELKRRGH